MIRLPLSNNGEAYYTTARDLPPLCNRRGVRLLLSGETFAVTVIAPRPDLLFETAALAGAALSGRAPFAALAALAAIAYTRRIPPQDAYAALVESVTPLRIAAPAERQHRRWREIEALADAAIAAGEVTETRLTPWDAARLIITIASRLWEVEGEAAARFGLLAVEGEDEIRRAVALIQIAAALRPDPDFRSAADALVDRLAIASGPHPIPDFWRASVPRSESIIALGTEDRALALSKADADAYRELARALLADATRPPRALGQLLEVRIPNIVAPLLARWGVGALWVTPHPTGLWVAIGESVPPRDARAFWRAVPESGERVPLTFPPALWVIVHLTLAALWRDLCAEAVTIVDASPSPPSPAASRRGERTGTPRRSAPAPLTLPPIRRLRWADDAEETAIRAACAVRGFYRRLPAGWEERQGTHVQRLRAAAAERAEAHGVAAPPPGYTFVRPHARGGRGEGERAGAGADETVRVVRARGLLALALALREDDRG